jgi:myosin-crossreactive antigen
MELTLTEKSAVLVGSGLAMLAGRFLFFRGGAGEEADA